MSHLQQNWEQDFADESHQNKQSILYANNEDYH